MSFTLKQFLELMEYKTNDNSEYFDATLGEKLWCSSYWNEKHGDGGYSFQCIHNQDTLEVVQLEAHDYTRERSYRWNPEHLRSTRTDEFAYDRVRFIDLEVVEDYVEKVVGIRSGLKYDSRVTIPVDFTDTEFLFIARAAHQEDVTINKFIENALKYQLEKIT